MNKILTIIKNLLLLVNIILLIILCKTIPSYGLDVVLYTFILGFTILVSIKDIIQKNEINKKYNVLFIISELMVIFIFMRTLYDPAFIYNSTKHMKTISDLGLYVDDFKYMILIYLEQNVIYFIIMLLCLYIYRRLNIKFHNIHLKERILKNYSVISIIFMLISICTLLPTLLCFAGDLSKIPYLIFTIVLIGVEIYELIKNNNKKKEWIIYVSFAFNMMALISIFI